MLRKNDENPSDRITNEEILMKCKFSPAEKVFLDRVQYKTGEPTDKDIGSICVQARGTTKMAF